MEKTINEDVLKKVINGIITTSQEEASKRYADSIAIIKKMDMESYDMRIRFPLEQCVDIIHKSDEGAFIFSHYGYVESCFNRLISDNEGSPCCADKSRYIIKGLYRQFEGGDELRLEKKDESFWISNYLTVDKSIKFLRAIWSAYYGNHIKLFEFYRDESQKNLT